MALGMGGAFGLGGLGGLMAQQGMQAPEKRGGFGQFLFGSPEKYGQLSRYSPENQSQFNQIISQLLGRLGGGEGSEFDFGPIEDEARAGFEQKTLPSIAERFTQMGAGGGRSSAFGQQLGAAGADLERSLGSMRQQYGLQRQGLLQNLLGLGQQEPFYQPRSAGFLENFGSAGAQGLGQGLGAGARGLMMGGL